MSRPIFRTGTFDVQGYMLSFKQPFVDPYSYTDFIEQLDKKVERTLASIDNDSIVKNAWYIF